MKFWVLIGMCSILSVSLGAQEPLRVLVHDSFAIRDEVLQEFEDETGYMVEIIRAGDAGQLVNQAILTKDTPLADVIYGVDNTFLSRALENDIFVAYESDALATVNETLRPVDDFRVTPVDYGDVCLNYDIAYFETAKLDPPMTFEALLLPQYRGLLVTSNPATSSPGLAFLLATIARFGTEGDYTYLDYWRELLANDALVVDGWETAYFGYFTAATEEGDYPLVVSYASSPAFTVNEAGDASTTASILADGMCFRQIEYAAVLHNATNESGAQAFIDFVLSEAFQAELPEQMYVYPVREGVSLPDAWLEFAQVPLLPVTLPAEEIEANRDQWIQDWVESIGQ